MPLKVEFTGNKILLYQDGVKEFDIQEHTFTIKRLVLQAGCSACSGYGENTC